MLEADDEDVRETAFWRVAASESESAAALLQAIAQRGKGRLRQLAVRELTRRERRGEAVAGGGAAATESEHESDPAFAALWRDFERLDAPGQRDAAAAYLGRGVNPQPWLIARLESPAPRDRAKALRMLRVMRLGRDAAEAAYRLANDRDAMVRSAAVSLLGDIGDVTARRILRRCLDDPDPRVASNAIEAMDRLGEPGREGTLLSKLEARHHRVRASAVATLLQVRVERAGEALLDMLEDRSRPHRIAALWVIERLQLGSLLDRVEALAEKDPDQQVRRRAARVWQAMGIFDYHSAAAVTSEDAG